MVNSKRNKNLYSDQVLKRTLQTVYKKKKLKIENWKLNQINNVHAPGIEPGPTKDEILSFACLPISSCE